MQIPRSLRRVAVAVLVAAVAVAVAPAPANAAPTDLWGFAYVDNPTVPLWTNLNPAYQATSPASPNVQGGRISTGLFEVKFLGLGIGPYGNVHVTAVSKKGFYCETVRWDASGSDEFVDIACFAPGGAPVDSPFSVLWTFNSTLLPPASGTFASLQYVLGSGVKQFYNSTGAIVTATPVAPGVTNVRFQKVGLGGSLNTGNVQVTAQDFSAKPHWCKVGAVDPAGVDVVVVVYCFDQNGKFADSHFTASFARQRPVIAAVGPPKYFGYAWSPVPLPANATQTNYNNPSGGFGFNLVFSGSPVITVRFPNLVFAESHAQVTANGADNTYCTLAKTWFASGTDLVVTSQCYDPTGTPTPSLAYVAAVNRV